VQWPINLSYKQAYMNHRRISKITYELKELRDFISSTHHEVQQRATVFSGLFEAITKLETRIRNFGSIYRQQEQYLWHKIADF
jgi:hypothetical protein